MRIILVGWIFSLIKEFESDNLKIIFGYLIITGHCWKISGCGLHKQTFKHTHELTV